MHTRLSDLPASRLVGYWVLLGVFLLIIQVILGGITRLTGSGLSITEWNIVTGTLPPLNEAQWITAFEKYRQTTQFHLLNADFRLSDFKFIFFWEWFHRIWARGIALVFLLGFAWLVWKGKMRKEMIRPLIILFLLGAAQAVIGWIMVVSGLTGDAVYVQPTKLALHFSFALALICYAFWFALSLLLEPVRLPKDRGIRRLTLPILVVLFLQLSYGALMAGHKAAVVAPTWPAINGEWIPSSLWKESPPWLNLIDNTIAVQFVHRGLAYVFFLLLIVWSLELYRRRPLPARLGTLGLVPLLFCCIQILLGIGALLTSPGIVPNHWAAFDWMAQLHQVNGILLLLTMVYMFYLVRLPRTES